MFGKIPFGCDSLPDRLSEVRVQAIALQEITQGPGLDINDAEPQSPSNAVRKGPDASA
jgi:hypothetical protein